MSSYLEKCIRLNSSLSDEIKKKILLKAGKDIKKIKEDPNFIPRDEDVLQAVKDLKNKGLRDKYESSKNLLKINDIINRIDSIIKAAKNPEQESKLIKEFLLSKLESNRKGNLPSDILGETFDESKTFYIWNSISYYRPVYEKVNTLNNTQLKELDDAIVAILDGNRQNLEGIDQKIIDIAEDFIERNKAFEEQVHIPLMNEAGIIIDPIENYYFHQTHDQSLIAEVPVEEYVEFLKGRLDPEKTKTPDGKTMKDIGEDEFTGEFYQNILFGDEAENNPFVTKYSKTTLKNQLNQPRIFQFKTAADALAYKRKFGIGNSIVVDTLNSHNRMSDKYALARSFGSDPEYAIDVITKHYKNNISESDIRSVKNHYNVLTGKTRFNKDYKVGAVVDGVKSYTMLEVMGGILQTSLTDTGTAGRALYQAGFTKSGLAKTVELLFKGIFVASEDAFHGTVNSLKDFAGFISNGKIKLNKREMSNFNKNITTLERYSLGLIASRFDTENANANGSINSDITGLTHDEIKRRRKYETFRPFKEGKLSKINDVSEWLFGGAGVNTLFKISGQVGFQSFIKNVVIDIMLNRMNSYSDLNLPSLKKENWRLAASLEEVGITPEEWDMFRNLGEDLDIDVITRTNDIPMETKMKMLKLLRRTQTMSVLEADPRTKETLTAGSGSKDIGYYLLKTVMFLKTFTMKKWHDTNLRINLEKRLRENNGDKYIPFHQTTETLATTTLLTALGFVILNLKLLQRGYGLISVDEDNYMKIVGDSFIQSGAGSFWADIGSTEKSFNNTLANWVVGPVLSRTGDTISTAKEVVSGEYDAYDIINDIDKRLPFNNLWYIQGLKDMYIKEELQKSIDEKKFKEQQRRRKRYYNKERGKDRLFDIRSDD